MDLRVGVVFAGRQGSPSGTSVAVSWLYVTGPDLATEIRVLNWGDGSTGTVIPAVPTTAFTYDQTYLAGLGGFVPLLGVATFATATLGMPGFGDIDNVALYLDPDADTGASFSMALSLLQSLMVTGAHGDTLTGGTAEDTVYAGFGDDSVAGGAGRDGLYGEAGHDTLDGGAGTDFLYGNAGDDLLLGGAGGDYLYAGPGDNTLEGGAGHDSLSAETGSDLLQGGAGNDTLGAGDGQDTLLGGGGADELYAWFGRDSLNGGAGNDTLLGQADDDTINGGASADMVVGGLGADRLVAAADGAEDRFRYDSLAEGGDRIIGFEQGFDRIQIEFADPGPLFVGIAPVAMDPIGTYLFDTATSRFSYDPDGEGAAAPVLIATLVGITAFSGADLWFTL
jgi:Ca2+-binding RTX toxin-like protein